MLTDYKTVFEWTTAEEGQVDDMILACPSQNNLYLVNRTHGIL